MNDGKTINREISWLHFNERVLQEAIDPRNPLLERIRFLGIFSNNRDEFFKVRIATISRLIKINVKYHPEEAKKYKGLLAEILTYVEDQELKYTAAFDEIQVSMRKQNIFLLNEKEVSTEQGTFIRKFFQLKVRPVIFPIVLDKFEGGYNLKDKAIYLAIQMTDSKGKIKEKQALIQIPTDDISRFVVLPKIDDKIFFMFIEDVIRYNLDDIFSIYGFDTFAGYILKFTRDAELDIDNDVSKSFLEIMSDSVKKRKKGLPVRFVYDKEMPETLLKKVTKKLNIITSYDQLRGGGRYHNFKDFMNFPELHKGHTFKPQPPVSHPDIPDNKSIFSVIAKKDIMINYPYQPFQHTIDFLREASIDPQVKSIKMTFYRAAKKSRVMNALINAARNGKIVTVFIELQARFDEEDNIYWARSLQNEGIKVLPTIQGLKVHAKVILVRRKEHGNNVYYSNISTGNFNESTAKVYSDLSLLTANQDIAADINNIFNLLESRYLPPKFKVLHVSPFNLRSFIITKILQEMRNKRLGEEAWVMLKANSLVDDKVAEKIYEANEEGVKFKLIIRGINIIKSGIPGMSENIEARSIVGRYLEHSRIFIFANGGNPEYFISSADIMTRNLDHRFEIICPILDVNIKKQIKELIDIQWKDNQKSRSLDNGKINNYINPSGKERKINTHDETYNYFEKLNKQ
ncbi:MAG: polyphosphate kinase 1 [Bacteroidetes bacterium CG2_30_33_31]|nr:MAG: polyphosphate kinase 1 [Bacteroidetes bacterium CG2_30_33_31]